MKCFLLILLVSPAFSKTFHQVHFKGTESELDVYTIKGRLPGPTVLIVGGIQGNEPGGYLAADLYADLSLRKGTIIVVPRANFVSIVRNKRGIRGDMNRKFAEGTGQPDQDVRVVEVIKELMKKSDFFLNLHDGSGFYAPTWQSPARNPMKYGQSVIADGEFLERPGHRPLSLDGMAGRVIERVNSQIADPKHLFHFNNHKTRAKNTRHKEQRRSATFYAMTKVGIPAFGIETSKSIPDYRLRVRYQTMVINSFLEEFGIVPEHPNPWLQTPVLKYLIVSVNGRTPIVVTARDVVKAFKGDRIRIVHIESNYSRGLTVQFKDAGRSFNDLDREVGVTSETAILVRKDRFIIAEIPVQIIMNRSAREDPGIHLEPRVKFFCIRVNDKSFALEPGEELAVMGGDKLVILDPQTNLRASGQTALRIDLRGFQASDTPYPTEDRGHIIDTDRDLQRKYAHKRGLDLVFPLQAKLSKKVIDQCYIAVKEPKLEYVVLRGSGGESLVLYPGDELQVPADEVVRIIDMRTNMPWSTPLFLTMAGRTIRWEPKGAAGIDAARLTLTKLPLDVTRRGRSLGRIWVKKGKEFRVSSKGRLKSRPLVPVRY
ncbi:M14/M99 family metallopeptidase [Thermodesulfobacteriota bacterium]